MKVSLSLVKVIDIIYLKNVFQFSTKLLKLYSKFPLNCANYYISMLVGILLKLFEKNVKYSSYHFVRALMKTKFIKIACRRTSP